MRRSASALLLALVLATPAVAPAQAPAPAAARPKPAQLPTDSMELGRKYTQWLYTNMVDSLVAHMDSASRAQPNVRGEYEQRVTMVAERGGNELKVVEEKFITRNGARQYWRIAIFDKAPEPVLIRWVIGPKGELMGVGLGLLSQAPAIDP